MTASRRLSFAEYLVARKGFSHDAISTLSKLIYTSRLALAAAMPGEIKIEAPSTDKDANVLVHPGALAYLTDDQKTFFDHYGDDHLLWLADFPDLRIGDRRLWQVISHRTGRTRRLRLLQRLLDLVRKAPTAPSLEALDQMQSDVDQLVVAIIHQGEHEEYDQYGADVVLARAGSGSLCHRQPPGRSARPGRHGRQAGNCQA